MKWAERAHFFVAEGDVHIGILGSKQLRGCCTYNGESKSIKWINRKQVLLQASKIWIASFQIDASCPFLLFIKKAKKNKPKPKP